MNPVVDAALDLTIAPGYTAIGYRLRGLDWESAVAGRLAGRAALVTGASSGIGEAVCEGLARGGARVHMVVRDRNRGERARKRILRRLGARGIATDLRVQVCDVSEPQAIADFGARLCELEDDLAVLVNNAGVLLDRRRRNSAGTEMTFATSVLGAFALTAVAMPLLRAAAGGRVVNVSSGGMYTARLDGSDPDLERRDFDGSRFYAHAKRAQVVLTELWAKREPKVTFAAMHPGWVDTPGLRHSLPGFHRLTRPLLRDAHQGADTIVWLATAPASEVPSGRFWQDRRVRPTHRLPNTRESAEDRRLLWAACARLTRSAQPTAA